MDELYPLTIDVSPLDNGNVFPNYKYDNNIIDVKAGIIIPKKIGSTYLEIVFDSQVLTINVDIKEKPVNEIITEDKIYNPILSEFNISNDGTNAVQTTSGINNMLIHANQNNFRKVILPLGTYLIDETSYINLPSNLMLDLNGSTLKLNPTNGNNIKMINIAEVDNSKIINGIIEGDSKERENTDYSEFVHGIVLNGCNDIELDNLEIRNIQGYGLMIETGIRKNLAFITKDNLVNTYDERCWGTINPIDISSIGNIFEFSYQIGYGGWGYINDTTTIDLTFLDESLNEISQLLQCKPYREYIKPSKAKYVNLKFNNTLITGGNTDFGNSVCFITDYKYTDNVNIHHCNIHDCKCLGVAYNGGGFHNVIQNNIFSNNGQIHAKRDIDLEDGWEFMRNLVIRDNVFNSTNNIVLCAGSNTILYNNTFNGMLDVDIRATNTRIINNKFEYEIAKKNTLKCEWYSGSLLLEDNSFVNSNTEIANMRNKMGLNRIYFKNNTFRNGQLVNSSVNEAFKNLDLENVTTKGLFKDCIFK